MSDMARNDDEVKGLLERLARLPVANVGDAMDRISAVDSAIRPMWRGARVVARAYTVLTRSGDNQGIHEAIDRAASGEVLVSNGFADTSRALVGELLAGRAKASHLAGFVIDGAVRDVDEIERLGVPVFARAVTPAGPYKMGPHRQQVPIALGGQCVLPGDVIVADADGVVVIAFAQLATTVVAAEGIQSNEIAKKAASAERMRDG
ncbi:MAG: methyltransferase [Acidobacteria bacterium]|nr:methyltransferase [Acidobacteriota bacterium]